MKRFASILILLLAGCDSTPKSTDLDADSLYRWGDSRDDLEQKYGKGTIVFVRESIPDDAFAAATMREMISVGKPRPQMYEIFMRRNLGPGGDYYRDYVFFNDLNRVMFSARRQPFQAGRR